MLKNLQLAAFNLQ